MREADNFTIFPCRMSRKSVNLNLLEPPGTHRVCYGTPLPYLVHVLLIVTIDQCGTRRSITLSFQSCFHRPVGTFCTGNRPGERPLSTC